MIDLRLVKKKWDASTIPVIKKAGYILIRNDEVYCGAVFADLSAGAPGKLWVAYIHMHNNITSFGIFKRDYRKDLPLHIGRRFCFEVI